MGGPFAVDQTPMHDHQVIVIPSPPNPKFLEIHGYMGQTPGGAFWGNPQLLRPSLAFSVPGTGLEALPY